MKRVILSAVAISFSAVAWAVEPKTDWNADLDYLAKELPARHYDLYAKHDEQYFLDGIEKIKCLTGTLDATEIVLKMTQLVASMGDSHTRIQVNPRSGPFALHWFGDGLRVTSTSVENGEILGQRLVSINGVPVETIVDSVSTLFTVDNRASLKYYAPRRISSIDILRFFRFADSELLTLGLGDGTTWTMNPATSRKTISVTPDSLSYFRKHGSEIFCEEYFPEDKVLYMLYNECISRETVEWWRKEYPGRMDNYRPEDYPSIEEWWNRSLAVLKEKKVEKLIFDMRINSGGSSPQGTEIVSRIAKRMRKDPRMKLYVVVGRDTFSSAILNSMDFKRMTDAVFIGEETVGKPNHYGEVQSFQLPNSGIKVSYSTKYFKTTDEDLATIAPDVYIEEMFDDYMRGIDPVFEWVRKR